MSTNESQGIVVDDKVIGELEELSLTYSEISFTLEGDKSDRDDILRAVARSSNPEDAEPGKFERIAYADGDFEAIDKADGNSTIEAAIPSLQPLPDDPRDYLVDGFNTEILDQRGNELSISGSLVYKRTRTDVNGLSETRESGEWLFSLADGVSIAESKITRDREFEASSGERKLTVNIILNGEQAEVWAETVTDQDASFFREIPDAVNPAVDQSEGSVNTVNVTAPSNKASILPGGEWIVVEWEIEWLANRRYQLTATLGRDSAFETEASSLPIANSSLIAWYPFRDGTATDVTAGDSRFGDENDYSGVINGEPNVGGEPTFLENGGVTDPLTGPNSSALRFTDNFQSITGLSPSQGEETIIGWVNLDNTERQNLFGIKGNEDEFYLDFVLEDQLTLTTIKNDTFDTELTTNFTTTSEYTFFAIRQSDTGEIDIVVNGVSKAESDALLISNGSLQVSNDINSLRGAVSGIRHYNTKLSLTTIKDIYYNTKPNRPFRRDKDVIGATGGTTTKKI